jgi:HSP20 family protein
MNIIPKRQNETSHRTGGEQSRQVQYLAPMVDVQSTEEGYVIRAEMPGVDKAGLEITVENGELTILGHRRNLQHPGDLVHREITRNDFRRVYELDPAIDASKISARVDQGLLTLVLPKAERVKPRKISVE